MGSVENTRVCEVCGWEYWYEFDLRSGKYTKLSMCRCDIEKDTALELIEEKGLMKEYEERLKERLKDETED